MGSNPAQGNYIYIYIYTHIYIDGINSRIIQATKVNLWRSTRNVIEWFNSIPEKCQHALITFDVCEFYPSISEELLMKADLQRSPNKTGILLSTRKNHSSITKTHHGLKRTLTALLRVRCFKVVGIVCSLIRTQCQNTTKLFISHERSNSTPDFTTSTR